MIRLTQVYSAKITLKMGRRPAYRAKKRRSIKDVAYLCLALVIAFSVGTHFAKNAQAEVKTIIHTVQVPIVQAKTIQVKIPVANDERSSKLKAYLTSQSSPLADYSDYIIAQSDKYAIDWTKIVAISGMESNYCKAAPQGSYNCWGLGGHTFMYFGSYNESIAYMASILGTQYKWNENQGIKAKYCPASDFCNPQWADIVTQKSQDILATINN